MSISTFLILGHVSIAATAGDSAHKPYDLKIIIAKANSETGDLTLVIGANPWEEAFATKGGFVRAFYRDPAVYTLGNSPCPSPLPGGPPVDCGDETRWLMVDFRNGAQMEHLATKLKGRFKTICFDLSVLKFFKLENLHYFHQLLADDGQLYIPQPAHNYSIPSRELTIRLNSDLAQKSGETESEYVMRQKAWRDANPKTWFAGTLQQTTQALDSAKFLYKILEPHSGVIPTPIMAIVQSSPFFPHEKDLNVLIATKSFSAGAASAGSTSSADRAARITEYQTAMRQPLQDLPQGHIDDLRSAQRRDYLAEREIDAGKPRAVIQANINLARSNVAVANAYIQDATHGTLVEQAAALSNARTFSFQAMKAAEKAYEAVSPDMVKKMKASGWAAINALGMADQRLTDGKHAVSDASSNLSWTNPIPADQQGLAKRCIEQVRRNLSNITDISDMGYVEGVAYYMDIVLANWPA